ARCWTARRRPARALLVTPWPHPIGSRLRTTRRHRTHPSLLRPDRPLPPRPQRRPQTQPRPPPDPRHPQTHTPADQGLHRATDPGRQDPPRSKPLPQALPRPQPLPPTRTRAATGDLTNIEASLAQPRVLPYGSAVAEPSSTSTRVALGDLRRVSIASPSCPLVHECSLPQ